MAAVWLELAAVELGMAAVWLELAAVELVMAAVWLKQLLDSASSFA